MGRRKRVLFRFSHGLGDAVQFTIVLRHLLEQRPDWTVDVASLRGKHTVFHGLCRRSWDDGDGWPSESNYDSVLDVPWHESDVQIPGVPCTKAARYIQELGLQPVKELFRYWMADNAVADTRVVQWLREIGIPEQENGKFNAVVLHDLGNTSHANKNLSWESASAIARAYIDTGKRVILLDWDRRSRVALVPGVVTPPLGDGDLWGETGTGDAAAIRSLIKHCDLMVGIDSGPLHVAGTTDTPTIALWNKHHPNRYYDLADNVVHYVESSLLDATSTDGENLRNLYRTRRCDSVPSAFPGVGRLLAEITNQAGDVIVIRGHHLRVNRASEDLYVLDDIYFKDNYRFREFAATHDVKLVVDIGGNIGSFTMLAKEVCPDARVIVVEVHPDNAAILRKNVGHLPGVEIVEAACTYETQDLTLRSPHGEQGSWELVDTSTEARTRASGTPYDVQDIGEFKRVTLESLVCDQQIDFLKLDCEGSEYSILRNMTCRPTYIAMEWHQGASKFTALKEAVGATWDFHHFGANCKDGDNGGHSCLTPANKSSRYRPLYHAYKLQIAVPPGIGDAAWCAMHIESLLSQSGCKSCDIHVCYGIPQRSFDYWSRFPFVSSVQPTGYKCVRTPPCSDGIADYDRSGQGFHDCFDWLLVPNAEMERGQRIETCLPGVDINWAVHDLWKFHDSELERAAQLEREHGPYVVFYGSNLRANTTCGMNRNGLWSPGEWVDLAAFFRSRGLRIVMVGADYDRSYFTELLIPAGLGDVVDLIGSCSIGDTLAICRRSRAVISYQSGIGIVGLYMGCNVAMWWRPYGDSFTDTQFETSRHEMNVAWCPPGSVESGQYLPLVYTQCTPKTITDHAEKYWL